MLVNIVKQFSISGVCIEISCIWLPSQTRIKIYKIFCRRLDMCLLQGNQVQHRPSLDLRQMTIIKDRHRVLLPHPELHLPDRPNDRLDHPEDTDMERHPKVEITRHHSIIKDIHLTLRMVVTERQTQTRLHPTNTHIVRVHQVPLQVGRRRLVDLHLDPHLDMVDQLHPTVMVIHQEAILHLRKLQATRQDQEGLHQILWHRHLVVILILEVNMDLLQRPQLLVLHLQMQLPHLRHPLHPQLHRLRQLLHRRQRHPRRQLKLNKGHPVVLRQVTTSTLLAILDRLDLQILKAHHRLKDILKAVIIKIIHLVVTTLRLMVLHPRSIIKDIHHMDSMVLHHLKWVSLDMDQVQVIDHRPREVHIREAHIREPHRHINTLVTIKREAHIRLHLVPVALHLLQVHLRHLLHLLLEQQPRLLELLPRVRHKSVHCNIIAFYEQNFFLLYNCVSTTFSKKTSS